MNVQIVNEAPIQIAQIRHSGPYEQLSPKFDELWRWVEAYSVPVKRCIGIYWDNPEFVPPQQLRSAACAELPFGYAPEGLAGTKIELGTLAGGEYAVTRFIGPYEQLGPVWSQFTNEIERNMRRTISENPAFEVYVNDAATTPPQQLITDLYMPLA